METSRIQPLDALTDFFPPIVEFVGIKLFAALHQATLSSPTVEMHLLPFGSPYASLGLFCLPDNARSFCHECITPRCSSNQQDEFRSGISCWLPITLHYSVTADP